MQSDDDRPVGEGGPESVQRMHSRMRQRILAVRSERKHELLATVDDVIRNLEGINVLLTTLSEVTNTLQGLRADIAAKDVNDVAYPTLLGDVETLMGAVESSLELLLKTLVAARGG